ncbi:MAG TPA: dTMP kinase [Gemmatimonadales bacterium]|nr:dTMP kinase [Gemmatimonadales bacterium]
MSVPGRFVVLEGPEGAGKSTLLRTLAERARTEGIETVAVREPGGTPVAEAARRILLDHANAPGPEGELFLVLAARADLVRRVIRPALEAGRLVLADRFDLSTYAYQVAGRGLPAEAVAAANGLATGGLAPDLTLVLDVPPDVGRARQLAAGKVTDRLDDEDPAFHRRVADAYLAAQGRGVRHLDAGRPPAEVAEEAWLAIRQVGGFVRREEA